MHKKNTSQIMSKKYTLKEKATTFVDLGLIGHSPPSPSLTALTQGDPY